MLEIRKGQIAREKKQKETDLAVSFVEEQTEEEIRIEILIRKRYSLSQELALQRKKCMGTVDEAEWTAYCNYVTKCIEEARKSVAEEE